ncbi:MAG: Type 1 glutamine amidotransferase-like domain-containing protein, partial [Porphyromonadaceae bacterium]|nr:Type 1 glutamine amidotransferase-like domain-containing protein [Porphyromonadaceae bacterium]
TFYVEAGKKALEKLGLEVDVLEISQMSKSDVSDRLERNDMVYISGGNTFFLLQELKKKGADVKIPELIDRGIVYIGESAGSAILSPDVSYMKGLDNPIEAPELTSFEGLNVIDVYPLPHHTNYPFKRAVEQVLADNPELNLLPFSNKQAICVTGSEVQLREK